jgi:hypothetical protein
METENLFVKPNWRNYLTFTPIEVGSEKYNLLKNHFQTIVNDFKKKYPNVKKPEEYKPGNENNSHYSVYELSTMDIDVNDIKLYHLYEIIPQLITVLSDEKIKERPDLRRNTGVITWWLNEYMKIFMRDLNYELNLTPIPGPYVSIVLMALDIPYEIQNMVHKYPHHLDLDYDQLIFNADANKKLQIVNARLL